MKRMSSRVLLSVATVVCCACGRESPPPASTAAPQAAVHLEATACQPATAAEKTWLSPELAAFAQFAIACPVRAGATLALYVLSVDGYALEKSLPASAPAPALPKALLVLPDGRRVGTLPLLYPFDPPVSLDVTFTNWASNIPRTVELAVEDPGVGGNRRLPSLEWNDERRTYTAP
jgi:hypothetical protein